MKAGTLSETSEEVVNQSNIDSHGATTLAPLWFLVGLGCPRQVGRKFVNRRSPVQSGSPAPLSFNDLCKLAHEFDGSISGSCHGST